MESYFYQSFFRYDIGDSNQMEEIRKMTGICPQHDVLFDELTTMEHLQFFARIRGMDEKNIEKAAMDIIVEVSLEEKRDTVAKLLSGGQKRKLSVGIALIGDPKIIFLDEPTAGVDPYSRRHMWNLLKQKKEGKVRPFVLIVFPRKFTNQNGPISARGFVFVYL